jgi:hypothetical protein
MLIFKIEWVKALTHRDAASFAQFQILPAWLRVFGVENGNGGYTLPTQRRAIMTSTVRATPKMKETKD